MADRVFGGVDCTACVVADMSDILEGIRNKLRCVPYATFGALHLLILDSAVEIERLRAENKKLRGFAQGMLKDWPYLYPNQERMETLALRYELVTLTTTRFGDEVRGRTALLTGEQEVPSGGVE